VNILVRELNGYKRTSAEGAEGAISEGRCQRIKSITGIKEWLPTRFLSRAVMMLDTGLRRYPKTARRVFQAGQRSLKERLDQGKTL
jgi:hypothetical protein